MLQLIPRPAHRLALRLAHGLRKRWWRIRKPQLHGCRVLVFDDAGRVLLIRHSYGSPEWMLPGGGLGRGEDAMAGAVREIREEAGCRLDAPREIAVQRDVLWGADNRVHIVAGTTADAPCPDGREVDAAAFFAPDSLPAEVSPRLTEHLADWITAAKAARPDPSAQA